MERLQKVISSAGICSRRKAEELIKNKKVEVNGQIITELGTKVSGNDIIFVNGKEIIREEKVYFILNKPRGVISTRTDDKNRKTVVDLIHTDKRIFPVGRLDYDTSGIILLTNDGELTNLLTHPSKNVEKKYLAKVEGLVTKEELKRLQNGVLIDGKKTKKAQLKLKRYDKKTNKSYVYITISEGRNHQIKKMFNAVNHDVKKLKRETFAFLTLEGLKSGEFRELNIKEVKKLYNIANM